ncbi:type II CAAX prenyl endopeptidase Rce1 family protein [Paenibacillus donghaensis]
MISVTSFGYIIGHLRLTTGSVWPAIFLHAS